MEREVFCTSCGSKILESNTVCPYCGASNRSIQSSRYQNTGYNDPGGFGWGLLGFCVPIVGLILFLVWKDEKPNTAKAAGIGALISVGVSVGLALLNILLIGLFAI